MTAPGFCTCRRDFPDAERFHPPAGATWHYLCDKPTVPAPSPVCRTCGFSHPVDPDGCPRWAPEPPVTRPTGTGWPS